MTSHLLQHKYDQELSGGVMKSFVATLLGSHCSENRIRWRMYSNTCWSMSDLLSLSKSPLVLMFSSIFLKALPSVLLTGL